MEGINSLQLNNGAGKRKKAINWKRGLFLAGLLTLSVSHFLIFWVYMNFETVRLTFFKYDMYNELKFVGFERYVKIFKNFLKFSMRTPYSMIPRPGVSRSPHPLRASSNTDGISDILSASILSADS